MDGKRMLQLDQPEAEILDCLVEAMLEADTELQNASADQWRRILVTSCRRRKAEATALVTSC